MLKSYTTAEDLGGGDQGDAILPWLSMASSLWLFLLYTFGLEVA
jgi:hypothetical protein